MPQSVSALAVADNTRIDTRQRDARIRDTEDKIAFERRKKEVNISLSSRTNLAH
jgi:hypothetical protein